MGFLMFLTNVLLPKQTSTGLHKSPQGYLQQAKASEHAGGGVCNTVYVGAGGLGCSEGAAAKQEQAPQSWSCDGTFRSFSSEKRPKNKGWSSPWQLVLKQTDSERGESVNAPGSTTAAGYKAPSQQEEPFAFVLAMNASAAAAVGLQENSCLTCLVF